MDNNNILDVCADMGIGIHIVDRDESGKLIMTELKRKAKKHNKKKGWKKASKRRGE